MNFTVKSASFVTSTLRKPENIYNSLAINLHGEMEFLPFGCSRQGSLHRGLLGGSSSELQNPNILQELEQDYLSENSTMNSQLLRPNELEEIASLLSEHHQEKLLKIISRSENNHKTAASNAITILNKSNFLLSRRNLINLNLQKADISGANMLDSNLFRSDLRGANLRKASLINTNMANTNLLNIELEAKSIIKGHQDIICQVNFSPDGKYLSTSSKDRTLKIWDMTNASLYKTFHTNSPSKSGLFSPDGKYIIIAEKKKALNLFNFKKQKNKRFAVAGEYNFTAMVFSNDSKYLYFATLFKSVCQLDLKTESIEIFDVKHKQKISSIDYAENGKFFATSAFDGSVRVFSFESQALTVFSSHNARIFAVKITRDSNYVAGAYSDVIKVWDINTKKTAYQMRSLSNIRTMSLSQDGRFLIYGTSEGLINEWKFTETERDHYMVNKQGNHIRSVAYVPGQRNFAAIQKKLVKILEAGNDYRTFFSLASCAQFSHDDSEFGIVTKERRLVVWSLESGKEVFKGEGHSSVMKSFQFLQDSNSLVTGGSYQNFLFWENKEITKKKVVFENGIGDFLISPNKKYISVLDHNGKLKVYLQKKDQVLKPSPEYYVCSMDFSSDSSKLLLGGEDHITRIYDIKSNEFIEKSSEAHNSKVILVQFSRDNTQAASVSFDKELIVWQVPHLEKVYSLQLPKSYYKQLAISKSWKYIAFQGGDCVIDVWKFGTRNSVARIHMLSMLLTSIVFSADERYIAVSSNENMGYIWKLDCNLPIVMNKYPEHKFKIF